MLSQPWDPSGDLSVGHIPREWLPHCWSLLCRLWVFKHQRSHPFHVVFPFEYGPHDVTFLYFAEITSNAYKGQCGNINEGNGPEFLDLPIFKDAQVSAEVSRVKFSIVTGPFNFSLLPFRNQQEEGSPGRDWVFSVLETSSPPAGAFPATAHHVDCP